MTRLTLLVVALLALAGAGVLLFNAPTRAEDKPTRLQAVFEERRDSHKPFSVQFANPLVSGEMQWVFPDDGYSIGEVGEDYVCFSQPWNNGSRLRCTPFANIVSVNYLSP